jgi:phage N-6-adenine-methyltransferase
VHTPFDGIATAAITPVAGQLSFHPLAKIFPLLEGAAFDELVADIKAHGLREPICLYGGQVLDGRNRYRACLETGVEPCFIVYEGGDPLAFVISLNLKRRHLDESQRAVVAARLANLQRGDNQHAPIGACSISQVDAAGMLNVSRRNVQRAKQVIDDGAPELVGAVERGAVSVSAAADIARHATKEEQRKIISACDAKEILAAAKAIKNRSQKGTTGTGDNEWYTPEEYLDAARSVLGVFDLDPASSKAAQKLVKAERFYSEEDDGLSQQWNGRVWLNPPYAQPHIVNFIAKLLSEIKASNVSEAILLTHNYTDTEWFHTAASACRAICFTRGRIKFWNPNGDVAAPTQGQAFFYFGDNPKKFAEVFASIGVVLLPCRR